MDNPQAIDPGRSPRRRQVLADLLAFGIGLGASGLLRAAPRLSTAEGLKVWLQAVDELAAQIRADRIHSGAWQQAIDALNQSTALTEFLPLLDFDTALRAIKPASQDPAKTFVDLERFGIAKANARFAVAFFAFDRHQVITPHGHRGMLSAHAVVAGRLRVRTFDRIGEDGDALLLAPRLDLIAQPGFSAAISARDGNVHWFTADQAPAATLDVIVQDVDANGRDFGLDLVDPLAATRVEGDVWRTPKISWKESSARYQSAEV